MTVRKVLSSFSVLFVISVHRWLIWVPFTYKLNFLQLSKQLTCSHQLLILHYEKQRK